MPKRTNPFQRLVTLLEVAFRADGAKVSESKELPDKITGRPREVDVVVELVEDVDSITVGIEIKGGETPRRASVDWVECMWGKHQTLPTDKLVLVAKGGFSQPAKEKASWLGVDTYTLEEALLLDWPKVLEGFKDLRVVEFIIPSLEAVTVVFPDIVSQRPDPGVLEQSLLIDTNGRESSITNILSTWIQDPAFIEQIKKIAFVDADTVFEGEIPLKSGVLLKLPTGESLPVLALRIRGRCRKREHPVSMTLSKYRGASVGLGTADLFGGRLEIAVVERGEKRPAVALSVSRVNTEAP